MARIVVLALILCSFVSCKTATTPVQPDTVALKSLVQDAETAIVDVRIPEQFNENHAEGAINIPLAVIPEKLDFFRNQKNTVVYCNSGRQAAQAVALLHKKGIKNVYSGKTILNVQNFKNKNLKNLFALSDFSGNKPGVTVIRKSDKLNYIAVALAKDVVLEKHKTAVPATLTVLKGAVKFKIGDHEFQLNEFDVYQIPINEEHEVIGLEKENLFTIIKQL